MPIILTFDVTDSDNNQRNRVQEFFEKLGWEALGGTSYRYPPLNNATQLEDWINHVVPALMLFRRYLLSSPRVTLTRMTIDAHCSTGYDGGNIGSPAHSLSASDLVATTHDKFTVQKLLDWVNTTDYPYP